MKSDTRQHRMPFGAELTDRDSVRFRLWAPAADEVELNLEDTDPPTVLAMERQDEGWYELETSRAAAGSLYRFRIDDDLLVPDPASRFQPRDVQGPSEVIDPGARKWRDTDWIGRPWEEVVLYELHVGSFTPAGTFRGAEERLDHLVDLGVTAIELMPVADFAGRRNWGYDGVLPFAPDSSYGRPEDLKSLVQAAHERRLMVFLDVVYNHFGPEGNYLARYAPRFFTDRHETPWGEAIDFDGEESRWVRQFFIQNALYWLREYHFDGLRLDAVHAIADGSSPDILEELAGVVRGELAASRHVHLVLENDDNRAHYLQRDASGRPLFYAAQWNDDIHHALHVALTGEDQGYYADYLDAVRHLGRCLSEGFAYQGEPSEYRDGARRGEISRDLPPTAFVSFLQNHDQVGNRAFGERVTALAPPPAVRLATAVLLLAPSPPLLFMGQEWGTRRPFLFFCDFGPDLGPLVTEGRRREFGGFPEFSDPVARERIPDPCLESTFERSVLDWSEVSEPDGDAWLEFHRSLLSVRRRAITPHLPGLSGGQAKYTVVGDFGLRAEWKLGDASKLLLIANFDAEPLDLSPALAREGALSPDARLLYALPEPLSTPLERPLPPWSGAWFFEEAR